MGHKNSIVEENELEPLSVRTGSHRLVAREAAANSYIRELEALGMDTLDRMLRKFKGSRSGYTITADAAAGGMCMALSRGVVLTAVVRGKVVTAHYVPTDGSPPVILTEDLAQQLLEEEP